MSRKLRSSRHSGSALVLMMFAVAILLTAGVGLLSLGLHSRLFAVKTVSEVAARCAADAGMAKAVFEMNQKLKVKPWDDSSLPQAGGQTLPNCDATFTYAVVGDAEDGYTIQCTGRCGRAQRIVNCALELKGLFEFAIFAEAGIDLYNGAVVDWYNYTEDDGDLSIGTNSILPGAVTLKNSAVVNGNVVIGPDGNPEVAVVASWATIAGDVYAASEEYPLDPIAVPAYLNEMPSAGTINNNITITESAKYDQINLSNSKVIKIDGAVELYITGAIVLKNSAQLQVVATNPDASLTLYVGGDIEVKNAGTINNLSGDAKKLTIYGLNTCQNIILKNGSDFYGTIYAPNAYVEMKNSAAVYGAVVAQDFAQKNSAVFNYDATLRDVDLDDDGVRFAIDQWSEN
ncbi:MAG: DUF7305 domain-containing protein [Planctomycetota bacterium]|jgi:choice-of-anchor A domain-containing protein